VGRQQEVSGRSFISKLEQEAQISMAVVLVSGTSE